ncbi:helix-turn-helix transcriptional regulator [Bacteriovorax sp. PP10]|jgi:transcriptional regulator with XRE-family HTH domain|uniref:Helix-turn-helix transcriptional regulator n=1 Tax=Bacteriovorax antarcticus TaxID=3088717 RepID=A0ABU5VYH8_9BACT|nr:helix-turn-helix transcriptional regulator [Bacteriovorax sp. PP10]MEA9357374.1 helix-turn-helix transcriptional regulator [Bacteriovorax sp. PP10]
MGRNIKGIKDRELKILINNLAKNLKKARTEQGLSMQELATAAKISTSTIWELENVKAEDFRMSTITAIANQLGLSPLTLISKAA